MDTVHVEALQKDCNVLILIISRIDTKKTGASIMISAYVFPVDASHDRSVRVPDYPKMASPLP